MKYQAVTDQKAPTAHLSALPQVIVKRSRLLIQLPAGFDGKPTKGELYLYCPADDRLGLRRSFSLTEDAFYMDLPHTIRGLFEVR